MDIAVAHSTLCNQTISEGADFFEPSSQAYCLQTVVVVQMDVHRRDTKIVVVVGSQHQQTSAQVARLRADTRVVQIDPREPAHIEEILPVLIEGDGLVLTGGHTARVVLDALGIERLRVLGEVEVGMPWSLATRAGRTISIVTKAGGFGNEMALRHAVEFLEQPS